METATATAPAPAPEQPIVQTPAAEPVKAEPDFADFEARENALAVGKPVPEPKPAPAAKPSGDEAPALDAKGTPLKDAQGRFISRRQHETNERIRKAVEEGTAATRTELEAARREIAELRARGVSSEPQKPAAQPAAPQPKAVEGPPKPRMADFEAKIAVDGGYADYAEAVEAFQDARDAWREAVAQHEAAQKAEKDAQTEAERVHTERIGAHLAREKAFIEKTPDYAARTQAFRDALNTDQPLVQALLDSDRSAELILHLAEHQDDLTRIGALGLTNLPAALRELGRIEAQYVTPAQAAAPAPAKQEPKPKPLSSAPAIGTTLGTQPAPAADASKAAVARGDVGAFMDEEDRKAVSQLRRS